MRTWSLLLCLSLVVSAAAFALQSASREGVANNDSPGSGQITIEGCVTSINGSFSLETRNGMLRLKGDHDSLLGHNGQQVRITGTVSPVGKKGPQTLRISDLKKVSDTCQY
jgi:hypothetical protein